jgi:hypothetical protein
MTGLECLSSWIDCFARRRGVGVLSNAGAGHPPTDFSVFGYHLTGSTGTLFLFGIAIGAVASLGLCRLLTGTRPTQALPN